MFPRNNYRRCDAFIVLDKTYIIQKIVQQYDYKILSILLEIGDEINCKASFTYLARIIVLYLLLHSMHITHRILYTAYI